MEPSTNGLPAGRDAANGKFIKGYKGGPGNPFAGKVNALRKLYYECVTEEDMRLVVEALVAKARSGDVQAIKEYLERALGKADSADLVARIDELEAMLADALAAANAPRPVPQRATA